MRLEQNTCPLCYRQWRWIQQHEPVDRRVVLRANGSYDVLSAHEHTVLGSLVARRGMATGRVRLKCEAGHEFTIRQAGALNQFTNPTDSRYQVHPVAIDFDEDEHTLEVTVGNETQGEIRYIQFTCVLDEVEDV